VRVAVQMDERTVGHEDTFAWRRGTPVRMRTITEKRRG